MRLIEPTACPAGRFGPARHVNATIAAHSNAIALVIVAPAQVGAPVQVGVYHQLLRPVVIARDRKAHRVCVYQLERAGHFNPLTVYVLINVGGVVSQLAQLRLHMQHPIPVQPQALNVVICDADLVGVYARGDVELILQAVALTPREKVDAFVKAFIRHCLITRHFRDPCGWIPEKVVEMARRLILARGGDRPGAVEGYGKRSGKRRLLAVLALAVLEQLEDRAGVGVKDVCPAPLMGVADGLVPLPLVLNEHRRRRAEHL